MFKVSILTIAVICSAFLSNLEEMRRHNLNSSITLKVEVRK